MGLLKVSLPTLMTLKSTLHYGLPSILEIMNTSVNAAYQNHRLSGLYWVGWDFLSYLNLIIIMWGGGGADYAHHIILMSQPTFRPFRRTWFISIKMYSSENAISST